MKKTRKLRLSTETVFALTTHDLRVVAGGNSAGVTCSKHEPVPDPL
jgi:hypothetical protein